MVTHNSKSDLPLDRNLKKNLGHSVESGEIDRIASTSSSVRGRRNSIYSTTSKRSQKVRSPSNDSRGSGSDQSRRSPSIKSRAGILKNKSVLKRLQY